MHEIKVQAIVDVPTLVEDLVEDHRHELREISKHLGLSYILVDRFRNQQAILSLPIRMRNSRRHTVLPRRAPAILMPERGHWAAFNFHPTHGPEFEAIDSEGGLYEVVVKRREDQLLG